MTTIYHSLPLNLRPAFQLHTDQAEHVVGLIYDNLGKVVVYEEDLEQLLTSEKGHAAPQILNSKYLDLVNRVVAEKDGTPLEPTQKLTAGTPCSSSFSWKNGEVLSVFKDIHYEQGAEMLQPPLGRWIDVVRTCRDKDPNMPAEGDFVALYGDKGGQFPDSLITLFEHIGDDPSQDSWQWWMQFQLERSPVDDFISTVHNPDVFNTIPPEVLGHLLEIAGAFQGFVDALSILQKVM